MKFGAGFITANNNPVPEPTEGLKHVPGATRSHESKPLYLIIRGGRGW